MAARRTAFPAAEAALRTGLSVRPPGMALAAPASGLRGLSLPGLALLAAWGRKGTGGALAGCGQELPRLKPERPEEDERPQLQKREGGEREEAASDLANSPVSAESRSCASCAPLLVFGGPGLCPSAQRSGSRATDRPSVPRRTDERGSGSDCRGVPGAGGALGAPGQTRPGTCYVPGRMNARRGRKALAVPFAPPAAIALPLHGARGRDGARGRG
ncbi:uncharacterized protein M6G45_016217 [Spheniscus humboldti]